MKRNKERFAKLSLVEFSFTQSAYADYQFCIKSNPAIVKKINALIDDAMKTPFEGLGKPEALRFDLSGYWSRRINQQHKLVYQIINNELIIIACRYHY